MSKSIQHIEIERKYLVDVLPDNIQQYPHEKIVQGYILIDSDGMEVRIRHRANKYYLTFKTGDSLARKETEVELKENQFISLWPLTFGRRLEKTRYCVGYMNHVIEVDVYSGFLAGLVISEVEFGDLTECSTFKPPIWFGLEVTHDKQYKNKNLASQVPVSKS
jgi:adenylate cyclase